MALKNISGKNFTRSRTFKDIDIAMGRNPFTDDLGVVKNDNSIKQAIKNIVLTAPGEKPFQPLVGSRVYQLLFEPPIITGIQNADYHWFGRWMFREPIL